MRSWSAGCRLRGGGTGWSTGKGRSSEPAKAGAAERGERGGSGAAAGRGRILRAAQFVAAGTRAGTHCGGGGARDRRADGGRVIFVRRGKADRGDPGVRAARDGAGRKAAAVPGAGDPGGAEDR